MVEENLIQAIEDGTVRRGTARRLAHQVRASRNITVRIEEAGLNPTREQAGEKGLPYQTDIRPLHDAHMKRRRRGTN